MLPYFLASCLDTPTMKNSMTPGELSKTSRKIDVRFTILYMNHVPTYLWRNLCDIKILLESYWVNFLPPLTKNCSNLGHRLEKRIGDALHIYPHMAPFHTGPFLHFSLKKPLIGLMNGQHLGVPVEILQKKKTNIAPEHRPKPKLKVVFQPSIFQVLLLLVSAKMIQKNVDISLIHYWTFHRVFSWFSSKRVRALNPWKPIFRSLSMIPGALFAKNF